MDNIFQSEKDSIVFLGLMSIAYKNYDYQFKHNDGELTHAQGLNIFAAIIDNIDGELIGQEMNHIHAFNNPMLHAEQLTLKKAIERINIKRPRNLSTTSVENYYRNHLFNDSNSTDYLNVGGTIYTTLEPCPFCTSALLVVRMKRIVYILPDKVYGHSFHFLKDSYYSKYDIHYEQLNIIQIENSKIIKISILRYQELLTFVEEWYSKQPSLPGTWMLDYYNDFLKSCFTAFMSFNENDLITTGIDFKKNLKTLIDLQSLALSL